MANMANSTAETATEWENLVMDEVEKAERARMCASRRLSSCRGQLASEDMLKAARRVEKMEREKAKVVKRLSISAVSGVAAKVEKVPPPVAPPAIEVRESQLGLGADRRSAPAPPRPRQVTVRCPAPP